MVIDHTAFTINFLRITEASSIKLSKCCRGITFYVLERFWSGILFISSNLVTPHGGNHCIPISILRSNSAQSVSGKDLKAWHDVCFNAIETVYSQMSNWYINYPVRIQFI